MANTLEGLSANEKMNAATSHLSRYLYLDSLRDTSNMKEMKHHGEQSEFILLEILNDDFDHEEALYLLATLYLKTNRAVLVTKLLEPLAAKCQRVDILNNLAAAFRNEHYNDKARFYFDQALKIERHPDILANMAALQVNEGNPEKGIPYGREALALNPDNVDASWNIGLLLLENGEWEEGFSFYSEGLRTGQRIIRNYKSKTGEAVFWKGEDFPPNSTIVLHGEQGIGDELLFLQFLPCFIKAYPDVKVILDCHPRLVKALQRSFHLENVFPTRKIAPEWNETLRVDYKQALGTLPKYFWQEMSKNAGWLKPDLSKVAHYRNIIQRIQKERNQVGWPVVGISWFGGKKRTRTDLRSIDLEHWTPILEQDATFISLQYTPAAYKDVSRVFDKTGLTIHHWPDVTEATDYDHTIALVEACDLIISVNTSLVHVCGSMSKPCWTLTPYGHAWRYGKKNGLNPFYTSVEQFNQAEEEPWTRILHKVVYEMRHFIRSFNRKQKTA